MLRQTMRSTSPRPKSRAMTPHGKKDEPPAAPSPRLQALSKPRSPRAPSRRGGPAKKPMGFGPSIHLNNKLPANHAV